MSRGVRPGGAAELAARLVAWEKRKSKSSIILEMSRHKKRLRRNYTYRFHKPSIFDVSRFPCAIVYGPGCRRGGVRGHAGISVVFFYNTKFAY